MINSVDFATMLPRTAEAADVQGREDSQNQHAAEQTAIQFEKNTQQEAQQTVETQQSETEDYDRESEGGNAGSSSGRRKKKNEKSKKEAPMAPRSNSSFDIMI
jgi:hypothetical protein